MKPDSLPSVRLSRLRPALHAALVVALLWAAGCRTRPEGQFPARSEREVASSIASASVRGGTNGAAIAKAAP